MKINNLNILFWFSVIFIGMSSCKNEKLPLLDLKSNNVQFYATGSFNTDSIKIEAGVDKYYMNSTYYLNNQLYILKSTLEQVDCDICPNSLEISVSNITNNASISAFNIDSLFFNGRKFPLYFDTTNLPISKLGEALITVKDPLSFKHYSKLYYQPGNYLTITNVEPYEELNRTGQKTIKVSFRSDCFLKNDSLARIDSVSLKGVFAFAYPSL